MGRRNQGRTEFAEFERMMARMHARQEKRKAEMAERSKQLKEQKGKAGGEK